MVKHKGQRRNMTGSLRVFFAIGIFAFFCGNPVYGAEVEGLVTLRDTLRPNSSEAIQETYKTIPWTPKQRAFVLKSLRRINALAPGLLSRGAADGTLSVYRADLRTYAKGGTQLIVVDRKLFIYPDFSSRVLLHEVVHAADSYMKLSGSEGFREIFEPKIKAARALLAKEGLTPASAAAMPIGERRKRIERALRRQTGLPSAYAAHSLAECLAEVTSFWVAPEFSYLPGPDAVRLLSPFVNEAAPPDPVDVHFRQADFLLQNGQSRAAIKALTKVVQADPRFYQAFSTRGYAYLKLGKNKAGLQDLKQARDLVSPLQSSYGFYDREYKRVRKLLEGGGH
jgi:hypothetical protein